MLPGSPICPTMHAIPNQAVIAAYSPRMAGPNARATMIPPSPIVMVVAMLNPAVRAISLPVTDRRSGSSALRVRSARASPEALFGPRSFDVDALVCALFKVKAPRV